MQTRVLTLRKAGLADCESVFQWRNAPETRQHIFNPEPIAWEEHQVWFEKILQSDESVLLIAESDGDPVGVLRYDFPATGKAIVSIYLVPGLHGQGLGTRILQEGADWLKRNLPQIEAVEAQVLAGNTASHRAFEKAGYEPSYMTYVQKLKT